MSLIVQKPFRDGGRDYKAGERFSPAGVSDRTLMLLKSQRHLIEVADVVPVEAQNAEIIASRAASLERHQQAPRRGAATPGAPDAAH